MWLMKSMCGQNVVNKASDVTALLYSLLVLPASMHSVELLKMLHFYSGFV